MTREEFDGAVRRLVDIQERLAASVAGLDAELVVMRAEAAVDAKDRALRLAADVIQLAKDRCGWTVEDTCGERRLPRIESAAWEAKRDAALAACLVALGEN